MRQSCVDENLTVKEKRIYESARKRKILLSAVKQYQNKEEDWKRKEKHWEVSRFAAEH